MNLLAIAARVAGKSMLMMRDMGYNPQMLVYNAVQGIGERGKVEPGGWEGVHGRVNEGILKAWADAGLPDNVGHVRSKRMHDDPRNIIHELEHLIMDPDFDLDTGKSSSHSGVESVMEEVLGWGFSGDVDDDGKFIVADGAPDYMYPGAKTVQEAVDAVAGAPVSSAARKAIRDSAVHRLKTLFKDVMGSALDDDAGEVLEKAVGMHNSTSLKYALAHAFTQHVESEYDDWKAVMTEEREDGWRKFNLLLKKEMMKLVPGVHSKSPRQVGEEKARG